MRQDVPIALLGLVAGVAMLAVNLVVSHPLAKTIPLTVIAACSVYLLARWRPDADRPTAALFGYPQVGLAVVLFGVALLVALSALTGGRSVPFYVIASLLGTVVLLQLYFTPEEFLHPPALLAEVVLLVAALRFPALYAVPGYTGIDVWIHVPDMTRRLVETGSVAGMGDSKYLGAPLYHLLVAVTSLFADVPLRAALYLSVGTALVASFALVFAATRYLTTVRWALFAMALYGLAGYVTRWSIHLIPTSMSIAIFFGIVFLFVRRLEGVASLRDDAALVFLFLALALTHQLSSVIVLTVLGAALLAHVAYVSPVFPLARASGGRGVTAGAATTFGVATATLLGYVVFNSGLLSFVWSQTPYYGETLLNGAVTRMRENVATLSAGGGAPELGEDVGGPDALPYQSLLTYLDRLGFLLLLFGTTVGTAVTTRAERLRESTAVLVGWVAALLAVTLVPPLLGINSLLPGRWYPFLYVGMAMLTAVGFGYLRRDLAAPAFVAVAVLFALVYPGAMILSTQATPDAPAFDEHNVKYSYTESELAAAETLIERTTMDDGGPIHADHPYVLTLNRLGDVRFGVGTVGENGTISDDRAIYRSYQSSDAPVFNVGGEQRVRQLPEDAVCGPTRDRVYTNGDLHFCPR
ncbi:hypothetical protein [Halorubrum sp. Hd13]|uniref:hypothetical protein n=1 Tax=Halorubrum sp. Hd13 TaxID=1480728 RepID=UPI000B99171A|nr:hypothetical protein [Halorubrum sp. Hd13]OYR45571.1 hypothetical protein DJ81_04535 [Halorubrum sp. Hd13]